MIIRVQVHERKDQLNCVIPLESTKNVPGKWGAQQSDDMKRDPPIFRVKKTPVNCRSASKKAYHDFAWEERAIKCREEEKR